MATVDGKRCPRPWGACTGRAPCLCPLPTRQIRWRKPSDPERRPQQRAARADVTRGLRTLYAGCRELAGHRSAAEWPSTSTWLAGGSPARRRRAHGRGRPDLGASDHHLFDRALSRKQSLSVGHGTNSAVREMIKHRQAERNKIRNRRDSRTRCRGRWDSICPI